MKEKETNREEIVKIYESKRDNRFSVKFPESWGEFQIDSWVVSKITRPCYYVEEKLWDPIIINFLDPIGPSTSQKLFHLIRLMDEGKLSKEFNFTLESLDPTGVVVELWEITGRFSFVSFGGCDDYNSKTLRELTVEIKPINCLLKY